MSKKSKKQRKASAIIEKPSSGSIHSSMLARARTKKKVIDEVGPYSPPVGVIPSGKRKEALAMDSTDYAYVNQCGYGPQYFRGYPYLAMLAQRPEFRKMSETIAREMTRKWIKVVCTGDDDKSEKIKVIEAALVDMNVCESFRKMAEYDGFYGRGQLYVDVKKPDGTPARDDDEELGTYLLVDKAKITKDSLIGFNPVEPVWTYPGAYDSTNPLRPDYYKPSKWYVMGKTVHVSRLLGFVSREVPDLLKAAYNFGGLSLSQMAEPYVDNWIRTRNSIGDMVHSFSINCFKTNMQATLAGESQPSLFDRVDLFNAIRDNRGAMVLDKDGEEFQQVNTPLTTLDSLQAQAQEQMASVSSIPLVFLLGITPQGLNASSEGEILVFETTIHAMQKLLFSAPLTTVLQIIQLSKFGEIDPEITFKFVPLREQSEEVAANVRKVNADTDAVLIDAGVITTDESRSRIAGDADSPYHGLDVNEELDEVED